MALMRRKSPLQQLFWGSNVTPKEAKVKDVGTRRWVIAEGYIPGGSTGEGRALESHETVCILNTGEDAAQVRISVYFADREPAGPYRLEVPARRTRHVRFNDLTEPEPIPRDTDFASVIEADRPVICQHTRLDSRQAALALMSTMAYPAD
jgi:hypothetical protein